MTLLGPFNQLLGPFFYSVFSRFMLENAKKSHFWKKYQVRHVLRSALDLGIKCPLNSVLQGLKFRFRNISNK